MSANESDQSDYPSPKEMEGWLEREIADVQKAAELRIKDAARFVNTYARGEITAKEAENRGFAYAERWGDALPGVPRSSGLSDEEILARIDETRDPNFASRLKQKRAFPNREKDG